MSESHPESRGPGLRSLLFTGIILLLAIVGGAAAALYLKNQAHADGRNALEPAPDRLDFGEVWEDPHFSLTLPITNCRAQDIEVKRFSKSCNCSEIEPPTLTIPAWQTREVRLILDLTSTKPGESDAAVRNFEVNISPEIPNERQTMWWTVHGRVRAVMQGELPKIDMGNVSGLSQSLPVKRATLTTRRVVHSLKASCTSPNFDVKVEKRSAPNDNQFDVIVAMKKRAKPGAIHGAITVVPESSNGDRLPARQMELLGHIVSDIATSPSSVFFNSCALGTAKTETVTLHSLTGQSFAVTGTRCEGDGLAVEKRAITSGGGHAFEVKQKVAWSGEQNGKVFFRIRRPDGSEEEVVVAVSYFGN